jgi:hypothetical protein
VDVLHAADPEERVCGGSVLSLQRRGFDGQVYMARRQLERLQLDRLLCLGILCAKTNEYRVSLWNLTLISVSVQNPKILIG